MKRETSTTAVILAGGRGTRLLPSSAILPKPLVPIAPNMTMLELILRQLSQHNIRRVRVAITEQAEILSYMVTRLEKMLPDLDIAPVQEPYELGTAGAAKLIGRPDGENLLLVNSDILTDLPFSRLLEHHEATGASATVSLKRRRIELNVGEYHLSRDEAFVVGHSQRPVFQAFTSVGVTVLSSDGLDMAAPGERIDVPVVIERLLHAGKTVSCYTDFEAAFDTGTPTELFEARAAFAQCPERFLSDLGIRGFPPDEVGYGSGTVFYSGVVLRDKHGLLVFQERSSASFGYLTTFGGSSRMDEVPEETAARELYEETAIRVDPSDLTCLGRVRIDDDGALTYCTFYLLDLPIAASDVQVRGEGVAAPGLKLTELDAAKMTPACVAAVDFILRRQ